MDPVHAHLSHPVMTTLLRRMLALAVCLTAACTVSDSSDQADSAAAVAAADSAARSTVPSPVTSVPAPAPAPADTSASTTPPVDAPSGSGMVAFDGVPPLRVGMSASEARAALGIPARVANASSCSYLDTKGKSHAFVMMEKDTIVRFEVRDKSLATQAGVRVGDSERRALDLYAGRVTVQPHKYVPAGHYLVVTTPADASLRLVLETDGKQVTAYRVGREPAVEYVEGCG
jgi:hypothetical protein